jgi:hypothetical protein
LNFGISGFIASYFDQANSRFIFVPVTGTNTQIFSVVYSPAGALTGTKFSLTETAVVSEVRMFTHAAGSTVRMGIYDASNNLLWQSNTPVATVDDGEIFAQISSGSPSALTLPAGDYFVTFQTSTPAAVPSFTAGAAGDGFTFYQSFGASPATLTSPISTSARYTEYIVYVVGTDKNVGDGGPPVTNPLNGIKISVANSSGGLITLAIDVTAVNRGVATALTDFDDIPGRQSKAVPGLRPSHTFVQPGVFVATAKGIDSISGESRGFMRKQLALGARETGQSGALGFAASKDIAVKALKGKFLFTKDTPDQVSFSGSIVMPAGLDLARADGQSLSLGIGNITDSIVVSPKGKGATPSSSGRIKTLKVKFPRLAKGTTLTAGGEKADVQFTINTANLDTSGFDTEGITASLAAGEDKKKGADRNIQVALVLAGVPYEILAPVLFKLSSKQDAGTIAGRSSKR